MRLLYAGLALTVPVSTNQLDECSFIQGMQTRPIRSAPKKTAPDALLEEVVAMAHTFHTRSPEDVQTAIDTANAALQSILPELEGEHTHAREQVELQHGELQACLQNLESGHADLLASKRLLMEQCAQSQVDAAATKLAECENGFYAHVHGLSNHLPPCSADNPDAFHSMLSSWRSFVQDEWSLVDSEKTECDEATSGDADLQPVCQQRTSDYEGVFCNHRLMCSLTTACRAHEIDVFNSMKPGLEDDMLSRQQQYTTVTQVGCILDLIHDAVGSNSTISDNSLTACADNTDLTSLTLQFPDMPDSAPSVCPSPAAGDPSCPDVDQVDIPTEWNNGAGSQAAPGQPLVTCSTLANSEECFATVELAEGVRPWSDRGYTLGSIPQDWLGATVYQNPVRTYSPGMVFRTNQPVTLILWNEGNRNGGFPNLGWEHSTECVMWNGQPPVQCWKREVDGEVTIPVSGHVVGGMIAVPLP